MKRYFFFSPIKSKIFCIIYIYIMSDFIMSRALGRTRVLLNTLALNVFEAY